MKFSKSHDGTITMVMSPDEAAIQANALAEGFGRGRWTSTTNDRLDEMSTLLERASTCKPTDSHLLFNELHKTLLLEEGTGDEEFFERIKLIADHIDSLHHSYTDASS